MFQFDCYSNCGLPFGQSFGPGDEGSNSIMDCLKQSQVEAMEQQFQLLMKGKK